MISVKCPACGLVDWNVVDCKRCGIPLAGQAAADSLHYAAEELVERARAQRTARAVVAACALVALALSALGVLYLSNKPAKRQWFWSFYRHDPTVAEIIAHNLKVSGGAERLARLESFRATGRVHFAGGEAAELAARAPDGAGFTMYAKRPDKVASEIEFAPSDPADAGEPSASEVRLLLRRGFDGERGWESSERSVLEGGSAVPVREQKTRALEGERLEQMRHSAKAAGLFGLAGEYGPGLKLDGRAEVDWEVTGRPGARPRRGHEAYVVSGADARGKGVTFYFDTLTGLLLRADFEAEDGEGETFKVECYLGDYREVGGLKLPHRLHYKRGEEALTLSLDKYFPNDELPDTLFEPPAGE